MYSNENLVSYFVVLMLILWLLKSLKTKSPPPTELLVFPDKTLPCASVFKELASGEPADCFTRRHCEHAHLESPTSLIRVMQCLSEAEEEISVCLYCFTYDKLADLLIAKKCKGCRVRIITDPTGGGNDNDRIPVLKAMGIEVRERATNQRKKMHNKFVIIDKSMVLHGSANWSISAILYNDEIVTVCHEETLVEDFHNYFEKLWSQLPCIVYN